LTVPPWSTKSAAAAWIRPMKPVTLLAAILLAQALP
jgi:hypothetical protein